MRTRIWISALLTFVLGVILQTSAQEQHVICGRRKVKTTYLIQNGLDAKPGHWPWHAAIYYKDENNGFDYKCGGSIIDANTILTAGHCVFYAGVKDASEVSVHVGRIHISEDADTIAAGGERWTLPWLGFVGVYKPSDNTIDKRCAVTLLNEWYAVGPAHCFQNDGLERRVLFGGNTELTESTCGERNRFCKIATQMIQIQRIIVHPTYGINNTEDNIALIELLNPADTTQPNVKPICIPIIPKFRNNNTAELSIASHTLFPRTFANKAVDFIDPKDCTAKYALEEFPLFLETKRLCTQISNRAAQDCIQLKAGAPLQQLRRIHGRRQYFLRGFDLYGRSCSTSLPSVYSNVNNYMDWILYNMRHDILDKADETPNDEWSDVEQSWNTLNQDPDLEKLSLFNLDTCGVTTLNVDTVDDRTFYPWMGLLATHKNTMEPVTRFVILGYCNSLLLASCANTPCDHLFKKVEIKNILIHPSYEGDPKSHNIALIEFMKPADLEHRYIKPICLPLTKELRRHKPLQLTVVPFRNYDNEVRNLTLMLPTTCQERFAQEGFVTTLKTAPICTEDLNKVNKEQVFLKSGAMLQTSSRIDGQDRYFLRGINILNDTIEQEYLYIPYSFTNTDLYLDWILENMNEYYEQDSEPSYDPEDGEPVDSGPVNLPAFFPDTTNTMNRLYSPWLGYVTAHPDPKDLLCMVVLISEWYAVGAVHPLLGRTDLKLQLGSMFDSSDVVCEEGDQSTLCDPELQKIPITRMIVHPQYNPFDNSNDIMLLEMSRPVRKPLINPVCLPVDDQIRSYDISDIRAHAFNLLTINFVAKKLDEHTYFNSYDCQTRWHKLALNWGIENVTHCILAQYSPNTECLTSLPGFPVYTAQTINGVERYFLRGIGKAWPHFCSKYYPVIYTNIDTYLDWILQNMDGSLNYKELTSNLRSRLQLV
uniref:Peptidase S1 domain-containing protein n=1 Tax=Anopheles minimus TaxID=112268 RepID=A0A182W9F2_9DIPT